MLLPINSFNDELVEEILIASNDELPERETDEDVHVTSSGAAEMVESKDSSESNDEDEETEDEFVLPVPAPRRFRPVPAARPSLARKSSSDTTVEPPVVDSAESQVVGPVDYEVITDEGEEFGSSASNNTHRNAYDQEPINRDAKEEAIPVVSSDAPPLRRSQRPRRRPNWLNPEAYDLVHDVYPRRVAQRACLLKEVVKAILEDG
jgi:hypothetical protein